MSVAVSQKEDPKLQRKREQAIYQFETKKADMEDKHKRAVKNLKQEKQASIDALEREIALIMQIKQQL